MIRTKSDLKEYLLADKSSLGIGYRKPRFMTDFEWRYEIALRKAEYYNYHKFNPIRYYCLLKLRWLQLKYQTFIPMYTCEKGLSIAHIGGIRINGNAHVGEFCRIQEGVPIGSTDGSKKAPQIGSCVYIGSGAKIIGDISIAAHSQIAAGAVVIKDILDVGTYGGVPAKRISDKSSKDNLVV